MRPAALIGIWLIALAIGLDIALQYPPTPPTPPTPPPTYVLYGPAWEAMVPGEAPPPGTERQRIADASGVEKYAAPPDDPERLAMRWWWQAASDAQRRLLVDAAEQTVRHGAPPPQVGLATGETTRPPRVAKPAPDLAYYRALLDAGVFPVTTHEARP